MDQPTGGSSTYYDLPPGATQLQDLIQFREMNHAEGEMFCGIYRHKPGVSRVYNAQKVAWYAISDLVHKLRSAIVDGELDTAAAKSAIDAFVVLTQQACDHASTLQVEAAYPK